MQVLRPMRQMASIWTRERSGFAYRLHPIFFRGCRRTSGLRLTPDITVVYFFSNHLSLLTALLCFALLQFAVASWVLITHCIKTSFYLIQRYLALLRIREKKTARARCPSATYTLDRNNDRKTAPWLRKVQQNMNTWTMTWEDSQKNHFCCDFSFLTKQHHIHIFFTCKVVYTTPYIH